MSVDAPAGAEDSQTRRAWSGRAAWCLLAVTFSGAGLRLWELGRQSLWIDEGYTAYLVRFTPLEYVDDVRHTSRNILPPLYFALLHYWTAWAGSSESALRLPSVVCGILLVPLMYRFLARHHGPVAGLLAAGATSFSLFQIRYSQEARMYELLALLSLGSLHLLGLVLAQRRTWPVLALAVTGALIIYTHHYGILLLIAQASYVGIRLLARDLDRGALRRFMLSSAVLVVLAAPWIVIFMDQLAKVNRYPWRGPVSWRSATQVMVAFAGSGAALAVYAVLVLTAAYHHRQLPARLRARAGLTDPERDHLLLWLAFGVPMVLAYGYSVVAAPVFGAKYLIGSSLAFLALAALGAASLPGRATGTAAVVVALAATAPPAYGYYHGVTKEQWREATAYVEAHAAPGDLVLFNAGYGLFSGFDVYARRTDLVTSAFPVGSDEFRLMPTPAQIAQLGPMAAGHPGVWIVYSQTPDDRHEIAAALAAASGDHGTCTAFYGVAACRYVMVSGAVPAS